MAKDTRVGAEAIEQKGWVAAHEWLIMRRISQLAILGFFLLGPLFGLWVIKGNLASSVILDMVPLSDPHVLLQSQLAGFTPTIDAAVGALIVIAFYLLVGGRVFCSWVCPVNLVTDAASWLRRWLGLGQGSNLPRSARYWLLGLTLLLPLVTGTIVWELVNPVSILFRGILFGIGAGWLLILGIFLFELLISKNGWCGRLCPVGAFYSLFSCKTPLRVVADKREQCDDCMDCFLVCPEPQVIKPALKGAAQGIGPVITPINCTNCGRCIDVCAKEVFRFGNGFGNYEVIGGTHEEQPTGARARERSYTDAA